MLHSTLSPEVAAGKRYFILLMVLSLRKLEGLCGLGLLTLTASDAGWGCSHPKARLGRMSQLPHSGWQLSLAGGRELGHVPPRGLSGLWSQGGWPPPRWLLPSEQASQEHEWKLMAFSSLVSEVTWCHPLCSHKPVHLQGRGRSPSSSGCGERQGHTATKHVRWMR